MVGQQGGSMRFNGWIVGWLNGWIVGWLDNRVVGRLNGWLVGLQAGWMVGKYRLLKRLECQIVGWQAGQMAGWQGGRVVCQLDDWIAGWQDGWMVGQLDSRVVGQLDRRVLVHQYQVLVHQYQVLVLQFQVLQGYPDYHHCCQMAEFSLTIFEARGSKKHQLFSEGSRKEKGPLSKDVGERVDVLFSKIKPLKSA